MTRYSYYFAAGAVFLFFIYMVALIAEAIVQ